MHVTRIYHGDQNNLVWSFSPRQIIRWISYFLKTKMIQTLVRYFIHANQIKLLSDISHIIFISSDRIQICLVIWISATSILFLWAIIVQKKTSIKTWTTTTLSVNIYSVIDILMQKQLLTGVTHKSSSYMF